MCPACCRWHFAVLGWKDGPGYLYNGVALLFSFIVSRVILYGLGLLHLLKLRYVTSLTTDCSHSALTHICLKLDMLPLWSIHQSIATADTTDYLKARVVQGCHPA